MTLIIDGKQRAAQLRTEIAGRVRLLQRTPKLAVVLVGSDPASQVYVGAKEKACRDVGITAEQVTLPDDATQAQVLAHVIRLNADPQVSGILVQLPLPAHLNTAEILRAVDPNKDVDGFHPLNVGLVAAGTGEGFTPCTPAGCMDLLRGVRPDLRGVRAVVVGRSAIVGRPVAQLLTAADCTVTIAHSQTRDLPALCREAEVLVVAAGRKRLIGADAVRPGAIVIDVGIHRENGGPVGDVDFAAVVPIAGAITPVPGGVGPMTVAYLLHNTYIAAVRSIERESV